MHVVHVYSWREDFTLHLYSSVQNPKKVEATPTTAGRDPARGSGHDELDTAAQESKLIFVYMKSNNYRYLLQLYNTSQAWVMWD